MAINMINHSPSDLTSVVNFSIFPRSYSIFLYIHAHRLRLFYLGLLLLQYLYRLLLLLLDPGGGFDFLSATALR